VSLKSTVHFSTLFSTTRPSSIVDCDRITPTLFVGSCALDSKKIDERRGFYPFIQCRSPLGDAIYFPSFYDKRL
jgi:hypothetical protein